MVPEHIKTFLSTPIGKAVFKEIHENESKQVIFHRKNSFLNPPDNVVRWLTTLAILQEHEKNFKKSKNKA